MKRVTSLIMVITASFVLSACQEDPESIIDIQDPSEKIEPPVLSRNKEFDSDNYVISDYTLNSYSIIIPKNTETPVICALWGTMWFTVGDYEYTYENQCTIRYGDPYILVDNYMISIQDFLQEYYVYDESDTDALLFIGVTVEEK